jgi:cation:H+ antiporter
MSTAILFVGVGLVLLTLAADRFVIAAARLAKEWGMSQILIGAVVVGMGTSAPEFIVSVVGGGKSFDLAFGNIAGSNIANLSLVLGASVIVSAIAGQRTILRREGVLMLMAVALFGAFMWDGGLTRVEGGILAGAAAVSGYLLARWSTGEPDVDETLKGDFRIPTELLAGAVTLVIMLVGAQLLASGALDIAGILGVSEGFIGLTVVAIGTSLPELATAIAAARRRQNDLVIGNLLGSNLFNSLVVGAGVGLIRPGVADDPVRGTIIVMIGIAALAGTLLSTGDRLVRSEGVALLAAYAGYLTWLAV